MTARRDAGAAIKLGTEEPFALGTLKVIPAARQISGHHFVQTIEPRVMQVLVLLGRAEGKVVTRQELVERCWDGVIVGDSAINRIISRVRQIAASHAASSFSIETIAKVGYRLTLTDGNDTVVGEDIDAPIRADQAPRTTRRMILVSSGVVAVVAAGAPALWLSGREHMPRREAVEFFDRAELAQRQGLPDQAEQAVSFYQRAVAIDPAYAAAWGGLALAQRHMFDGYGGAEQSGLAPKIRSAAERALALDPGNADATLALILIRPFYRNWVAMERALRTFTARHADHWLGQGQFAMFHYEVGRWKGGIDHHRQALRIDPFLPIGFMGLANALSCAGRLQEAETVFDEARQRWPKHPALWITRYNHLLYTGRPAAALSFAMDPDTRPATFSPQFVDLCILLAQALASKDSTTISHATQLYRGFAQDDEGNIPLAAPALVLLGQPEIALAACERYFLNSGTFGRPHPPLGPLSRRYTSFLFTRPMVMLRDRLLYRQLLERTGLERYWRASGSGPDFRNPTV